MSVLEQTLDVWCGINSLCAMGMICFLFVHIDFLFLLNWCHIVQYLHHYIMVSHFVYTQLAHVIMMVADALASNRQQAISNHRVDLTVITINVTWNMANFLYPPLQQSWKGGILVSGTLSVCPSVDRIVSALYLKQYSSDPFHIYTSYQATSEGVSCVTFVSKFKDIVYGHRE